jgi:hypothetical protein
MTMAPVVAKNNVCNIVSEKEMQEMTDEKVVLRERVGLKRLSDEAVQSYLRIRDGKSNVVKLMIVDDGMIQSFPDIWGKRIYYFKRQRPYTGKGDSRGLLLELLDDMKVMYIPIRPGLLRRMGFSHATIKTVCDARRDVHPTKKQLQHLTTTQQKSLFL